MKDEQFEALMRDAAQTFRQPAEPDLDAMWIEIEREVEDPMSKTRDPKPESQDPRRFRMLGLGSWVFGLAATLVIGIALGRASAHRDGSAAAATAATAATKVAAAATEAPLAAPYDVETSRYLGQTAALLIALPSEVRAGRADEQFVSRASELLTRTRLLLDSPAAGDAQMRDLLDDLELVLAQIVRLQNNQSSRTELDLINRALEQRDVIPRLRTAVADISAN